MWRRHKSLSLTGQNVLQRSKARVGDQGKFQMVIFCPLGTSVSTVNNGEQRTWERQSKSHALVSGCACLDLSLALSKDAYTIEPQGWCWRGCSRHLRAMVLDLSLLWNSRCLLWTNRGSFPGLSLTKREDQTWPTEGLGAASTRVSESAGLWETIPGWLAVEPDYLGIWLHPSKVGFGRE